MYNILFLTLYYNLHPPLSSNFLLEHGTMNKAGGASADVELISESESEFDLNDPHQAIKQIFNCFDTDGDGFIDRYEVIYLLYYFIAEVL